MDVKKLLLFLFSALLAIPLCAESRPEFHVEFVPGEVYIRFNRGSDDGVKIDKNDVRHPSTNPALVTRGSLKNIYDKEIGTFVTVFADSKQSVARIATMDSGASIADVDHLEIPNLKNCGYLKFQLEVSENYFYMLEMVGAKSREVPRATCMMRKTNWSASAPSRAQARKKASAG
jgi:hypothetical protein